MFSIQANILQKLSKQARIRGSRKLKMLLTLLPSFLWIWKNTFLQKKLTRYSNPMKHWRMKSQRLCWPQSTWLCPSRIFIIHQTTVIHLWQTLTIQKLKQKLIVISFRLFPRTMRTRGWTYWELIKSRRKSMPSSRNVWSQNQVYFPNILSTQINRV